MKKYILLTILINYFISVYADNVAKKVTTNNTNLNNQTPSGYMGTGLSLIFGLGVAGLYSTPVNNQLETNKSGFEFQGRGLISFFVEKIALEAGAGWFYSRFSSITRNTNLDEKIHNDIVLTQAAFVELVAAYRLNHDLMLGPLSQIKFGTDTSYSPFSIQTTIPRVFLGFQTIFGNPRKFGEMRYAIQFLTDINIDERQFYALAFNINFGVPIIKPDLIIKENEVIKEKEVIKYETKYETKYVNRFLYSLDTELINFEFNKATLLPTSITFLEKLGDFLLENSALWNGLDIGGHTDNRGNADYNLKLSKERAEEVKTVLIKQGIASEKIKSWGFGSTRPLSNENDEKSYAMNRRVEMSFEGISDINVNKFRFEIDRIRKSIIKPSTCEMDKCK